MLLLTFRVAQDLYAVDVTRVVEVVPRVDPRPIPRTPEFLAGLFGYRGRVVPAIDMGLLLGKTPSPVRLSTRVILVETRKLRPGQGPSPATSSARSGRFVSGETLLLGLIAEQVNDIVRVDQDKVVFPSMQLDAAPYLGAIVQVDPRNQSLAQLIEVDRVLSPSIRDALFGGWEKTDEHAADPGFLGHESGSDVGAGAAALSQSEIDLGVGAR